MISDSGFDFEVFRFQLAKKESALAKIGYALANLYCELEQIRVELLNLDSLFAPVPIRVRNSSVSPSAHPPLCKILTAIKKCRDIRRKNC